MPWPPHPFADVLVGAALVTLPAEAQDHRFETDPVVTVRENFVACDVLSGLFGYGPVCASAPATLATASNHAST